jgi:proteasome accessory factor B
MILPRLQRLLRLIHLLQSGKGYRIDGLAQECGVCRRTVFRDLGVLRDAGVPLRLDEQRGEYVIPGAAHLKPSDFTPEEAMALLLLCHELGGEPGLPFLGPALTAAVKLENHLPARLRERLRAAAHAVRIEPPPRNPLVGRAQVFEQLLDAAVARRCVRIRYQSLAEEQHIGTRLSPYQLLFSQRSWYVIGRSSLHRGVRTFNLSRIAEVTPLEETFAVPRRFSLQRHLRNAWRLIAEPGPDREVVVRFSRLVAQNVAEIVWHRTQQITPNADGTLDYRVRVSGLGEISWWIMGYGDQAEVLQPPELRRLIAQRAAKMVEVYGAR